MTVSLYIRKTYGLLCIYCCYDVGFLKCFPSNNSIYCVVYCSVFQYLFVFLDNAQKCCTFLSNYIADQRIDTLLLQLISLSCV